MPARRTASPQSGQIASDASVAAWSGRLLNTDGTFLHTWLQHGRLINPDGTFVGDLFEIFDYADWV